MSGIEPILIGAALGAGTSAAMGGDPLKGALMGGVTGGVGAGIGGAAAGSAGATAASTGGGAASLSAANMLGTGLSDAGAAALMGTGLSDAAMAAQAMGFTTATDAIGAGLMDATGVATQSGMERLAAVGAPLASKGGMSSMMQQMSPMMQGIAPKPPQPMSAPSIKGGQAPQVAGPVMSLMDERQRPQRRRLSLL